MNSSSVLGLRELATGPAVATELVWLLKYGLNRSVQPQPKPSTLVSGLRLDRLALCKLGCFTLALVLLHQAFKRCARQDGGMWH